MPAAIDGDGPVTGDRPDFLGDSDCAALIRGRDWSATPLGPREHWPQSLCTMLGFLLRSPVAMVMLWGLDGIMLYNDAYARFAGTNHPGHLGSPVRQNWPEVADFNETVMRVGFAGGTLSYRDQEMSLYRHGLAEQVFMDLDYSPILGDDGRPAGVLAVVVETTARVLAQREQASLHQRQARMFAEAPGIIALLEGPDHVYTMSNAAHDAFAGRRAIGLPIRQAVPEIAGQGFYERLDAVYASGEPDRAAGVPITLAHGQHRGCQRLLDFIYQPMHDARGRVCGIFVEGIDVTERAEAESRLQQSITALASAQEAGKVGTWRLDDATGAGEGSDSARRILGIAPDEPITAELYWSLLHPESRSLMAGSIARLRANQHDSYEHEVHIMRRDGSEAWVLLRGRRVPVPDGVTAVEGVVTVEGVVIDITERKLAQIEAERALNLLNAVLDGAPDPIFAKDTAGRYLLVNKATLAILGRTAEQIIGRTATDLFGTGVADALAAADGQALAGNSATFEERVPDAATGELRVFLATKSPLRGVDGAVSGTVTVTRDVTSRVHAEAQLRASEERLRLAFEVGGIGAWDIDLLTGYIVESPEIGAMFGLAAGQTTRNVGAIRARIHPDDFAAVEAGIVAAMGNGEPFAIENRILRGDGSTGWIALRGRVLYDDGGTAIRAVGVARDITADRAAQRAIIESEDRFRTLTDQAPALIFAADAAGNYSFVNRRYMDYTGESFQALCGVGWHAVVHPDDLAAIRDKAAARQQDSNRAVEHRLRIRGRDGSWRWFLLHAEPVAHGRPATPFHWMGICVDIDAQVQAEERERLLAAEVDHRAKNMLAVVQAVVQLTRADTAAALKTAINDRIASLARAHSLLAASRWEGINLGELAREELAAFRERVELGGPEVRLRPAAAQALALVLHELTTNAVKYGGLSTPQGALTLTWAWTAGDGGQQLAIRWVETGGPPVVPPQVRGFGSTVLKSSIERQLHGRLKLDWRSEGLICELWLPADQLAVAEPPRPPAPPAAPRPAVPAALLSQQRLLIVEDELLVALQLEALATEAGCAIVGSAASSVEARAILAAHAPTMALLDINLGTERSYDFADTLMARGVPFAFCTGYAGDGEVPDRFKGCIRLTKPVDAAQLRQVLGQLATG